MYVYRRSVDKLQCIGRAGRRRAGFRVIYTTKHKEDEKSLLYWKMSIEQYVL